METVAPGRTQTEQGDLLAGQIKALGGLVLAHTFDTLALEDAFQLHWHCTLFYALPLFPHNLWQDRAGSPPYV